MNLLSEFKLQKKILILGDSLTFGRPKYGIFNHHTWPRLVAANGYEVFHRGRGGSDTNNVLEEAKHLYGYMINQMDDKHEFDICIIQVGIVDCTPRSVPRRLEKIIQFLPSGSQLVDKLSRSQFLTRCVGRPWVSLNQFKENISNTFKITTKLAKNVFFVEIAKPSHFLIENCGDFSDIVEKYNNVLKSMLGDKFLKVYDDLNLTKQLLPDGHHLTKFGHKIIAQRILDSIK